MMPPAIRGWRYLWLVAALTTLVGCQPAVVAAVSPPATVLDPMIDTRPPLPDPVECGDLIDRWEAAVSDLIGIPVVWEDFGSLRYVTVVCNAPGSGRLGEADPVGQQIRLMVHPPWVDPLETLAHEAAHMLDWSCIGMDPWPGLIDATGWVDPVPAAWWTTPGGRWWESEAELFATVAGAVVAGRPVGPAVRAFHAAGEIDEAAVRALVVRAHAGCVGDDVWRDR